MNGYLLSVIGTVLLCAILTSITPEGKTASVIKGVAKLACLLIIVSPILSFISAFPSSKDEQASGEIFEEFFGETVIQTDESFIQYYSEMRIRSVEKALVQEIKERFGVETSVTLLWERVETHENGVYGAENVKIISINVTTKTKMQEEDKKRMWDYLTKNYCSEVQIE